MLDVKRALGTVTENDAIRVVGRVRRLVGLLAEAEGLTLPVGSTCRIACRMESNRELEAEVMGFRDDRTLLVPCGSLTGISPGDPVLYEGERPGVRVSEDLLGRIVDGNGEPIDDKGPVGWHTRVPSEGRPISPMARHRIRDVLTTGVRAIDSLLTCGRGQRVGIFSGSGVGKSVLLGMLARNCDAPLNVIALIGERGREVREFVERDLGEAGLARSVVVVATANDPPLMRLRAARTATAIAEWFRDQGNDVLFLLDSITRVAFAQRELGLSAHEPPTTKAFPPSTFSVLSQLLERTGPAESGSISSFYTVLVEADDLHDPIGDAVRGILDGHIWLSRRLANRGHFPAVDVLESVSRVMNDIVSPEHIAAVREIIEDLSRFRDVEDLIQLGAYVRGADPRTDLAVDRRRRIEELLRQGPEERGTFDAVVESLRAIAEHKGETPPSPDRATEGRGS